MAYWSGNKSKVWSTWFTILSVVLFNYTLAVNKSSIFWKIDNAAWEELRNNPSVLRVANSHIVRQTPNMPAVT